MSNDNGKFIPVLMVDELRFPDGNKRWRFWCPWCVMYHVHDPRPDLYEAQCGFSSPYRATGYYLVHRDKKIQSKADRKLVQHTRAQAEQRERNHMMAAWHAADADPKH